MPMDVLGNERDCYSLAHLKEKYAITDELPTLRKVENGCCVGYSDVECNGDKRVTRL
ncbi:hypothetical protein HDU96_000109, partial [Phlyctochytrium bullatum]